MGMLAYKYSYTHRLLAPSKIIQLFPLSSRNQLEANFENEIQY